jgi:predicted NAD/FAD-binding protein
VEDAQGGRDVFDAIVIAAHADEALAMLSDPSADEARLLGAFGYAKNRAVLHTDARLAPKRRKLWSSWNYMGERRNGATRALSVTYWMNLLQGLTSAHPLFLTLNPLTDPAPGTVLHEQTYDHPLFNQAAIDAQAELPLIQGALRTYFCGAYFGSGFHEDGLQAGLWTAEALTGEARPWRRQGQNDRTALPPLGALK